MGMSALQRHRRRRPRRRAVGSVAVLALGATLAVVGVSSRSGAATPPAELISQNNGTALNGTSAYPSISADGQFVGFIFTSTPGVAVGSTAAMVRDRGAPSTTTTVLPASLTARTSGAPTVLSRDGCSDAFFAQDPKQVYLAVWNRCTGVSTAIRPVGAVGNTTAASLAISAHGRYLAYNVDNGNGPNTTTWIDRDGNGNGVLDDSPLDPASFPNSVKTLSGAHNPSLGDENVTRLVAIELTPIEGSLGIVQWDPISNATTSVAGGNGPSSTPSMSPDGRFVAFSSLATDLTANPASKTPQIFVRDMTTTAVHLVSHDANGAPGNADSVLPSISADGTQIAFASLASNLVAPPPTFASSVAIARRSQSYDIETALSTGGLFDTVSFDRASIANDGTPVPLGTTATSLPVISSNGRYVAFASRAPALIGAPPPGSGGNAQVFAISRPAALSFSPVDFGNVTTGKTSPAQSVTVTNTGLSSIVPASIASNNAEFTITASTCTLNAFLSPGQSCTVTVTFHPAAAGARNGQITIAETGFGAFSANGALTGTGAVPPTTTRPAVTTTKPAPTTTTTTTTTTTVALVPALVIDPPAAQFANVLLGSETPATLFTISSSGTGAVTVSGVGVDGADAGDYPLASDSCSGATLPPGSTCQVSVVFRPGAVGDRPATLTVAGSGVSASASLDGTGTLQPVIRLSPNVVDVGEVAIAVGAGFPANTIVQLKWSTRPEVHSVTTGADGSFQLQIAVGPDETPGPRQLQVIDIPGAFAGVGVPGLIVDATMQPPMDNNPAFTGITSLIIRG